MTNTALIEFHLTKKGWFLDKVNSTNHLNNF
jgi:hypothetical protein